MFMFQNGLLASFIPEIIMLIAYISCLVVPAHRKMESRETVASNKIEYVRQQTKSNVTTVSVFDEMQSAAKPATTSVRKFPIEQATKHCLPTTVLRTSNGQLSSLFSRPPPVSLC